ncbi:MAG: hypothetical protein GY853_01775 [PVC group bacterium]|nr:hypothetical protein [PVC group bacterium]
MATKNIESQTRRGPFGGAPGQGRPPKSKQLKNYDKALKILDDNIEKALGVLVDGLEATKDIYNKSGEIIAEDVPDNYYRFNCACVLIKKVLPDKKAKEITGPGGAPLLPTTVIDRRKVVMNIVRKLDELDLDEVKEMQEKGDFKLFKDADYVIEEEAEEENNNAGNRISEDIGRATEGEAEEEVERAEEED